MDQTEELLLALLAATAVAIVALLLHIRRQRRDRRPVESQYAASTEGETRCPSCGMGNLWTVRNCISCGSRLPG